MPRGYSLNFDLTIPYGFLCEFLKLEGGVELILFRGWAFFTYEHWNIVQDGIASVPLKDTIKIPFCIVTNAVLGVRLLDDFFLSGFWKTIVDHNSDTLIIIFFL